MKKIIIGIILMILSSCGTDHYDPYGTWDAYTHTYVPDSTKYTLWALGIAIILWIWNAVRKRDDQ